MGFKLEFLLKSLMAKDCNLGSFRLEAELSNDKQTLKTACVPQKALLFK